MKSQLNLHSSRFLRFTDVNLGAYCCLGTIMMYTKNKVLDKCKNSSFPVFKLTASLSCPHQVFDPAQSTDPPPCFPVSDNKLPENSSVFESAHGTRVCLWALQPVPFLTSLSLLRPGLAGATELAPYPRASVQKHRHCCSETRQTVMETAHFPDTWGGQKASPPEPGGEKKREKRKRWTTNPGSPPFLCAHLENGTSRLSESN